MNGAARLPEPSPWGRSLGLRAIVRDAQRRQPWGVLTEIARGKLEGPPVAPRDGVSWLAKECVERTVDEYDSVVAITGGEGKSKSFLALLLAREVERYTTERAAVDPEHYHPARWSFDNLCYTARDVINAYRRGGLSEVIFYDEGVRGLLAGETFDPEQLALTKALAQVREKGMILLVCVPDIFMLAAKVRGRRAAFWVDVRTRGTRRKPEPSVAWVFERDERLRYLPTRSLGLSRSLRCPEVIYDPFPVGDPFLTEYKATKNRRLNEYLDETDDDLARHEAKKRGDRPPRASGLRGTKVA